ncbi:MAG: alpha/beta hydrolase family esterase [Alphaproteobacteria bacterium]
MRAILTLVCLCLLALPAQARPACGGTTTQCPTEHGFYRLALPEGTERPVPAVIFLHGWGGSSATTMRNKAMRATLAARGYALIAPEGIRTSAIRKQKNWAVRDGREYERDDLAFLAEVLDDAATHGVDRDRVLMAGFSRGASMVWDVACHAPDLARAYAPVAGAFWEPLPEGCEGGAALFHTHGWADRVIPLEGRSVAGGALTQGDTFASLKILRAANGCETEQPDKSVIEPGGIWRRTWRSCQRGRIELMLHPGPHGTPKLWLEHALDWLEARLAED